jgi:3-oxoacyl-[acyl-carrier protein] reductase
MQLEGRYALITGASSGIGAAIALQLAAAGAHIAINYAHNDAGAEEIARKVRALGLTALVLKADISRMADVRSMFKTLKASWPRLDLLVNNAGTVKRGGLFEISEADWDEIFAVNLKGAFLCSQAAAGWMLETPNGVVPSIINISSMRGVEGGSSSAHYAAAKAGVISLTKTLARELAPHIRVNSVAPGYTETRIQAGLSAEKRREIEAHTPLGRIGSPEEIARVVAFLASEDASFMTGQTLLVDGGQVMRP